MKRIPKDHGRRVAAPLWGSSSTPGSKFSPPRWLHRLGLLVAFSFGSSMTAADTARIQRGQELYVRNCFACHQLDGAGVPGIFPPLAKSDYLLADVDRAIRVV